MNVHRFMEDDVQDSFVKTALNEKKVGEHIIMLADTVSAVNTLFIPARGPCGLRKNNIVTNMLKTIDPLHRVKLRHKGPTSRHVDEIH